MNMDFYRSPRVEAEEAEREFARVIPPYLLPPKKSLKTKEKAQRKKRKKIADISRKKNKMMK
jgi:hypothetical protein